VTTPKTIGVFDSGVGGQSVAQAIKRAHPELDIVYVSDSKNVPYGSKTESEIAKLVEPIMMKLAEHVDVIVIACNTVSTLLARKLREKISTPIVAIEPMVKPAAEQTKSDIIAVCATPATLASERYQWLKQTYAEGVEVLEPDCSEWSQMIESNSIQKEHVHEQIDAVCQRGADIIVLGCTHYHWIEDIVKEEAAGRAEVLQPEQPVITQLNRVLEQLG
jgi:glutamate racemase